MYEVEGFKCCVLYNSNFFCIMSLGENPNLFKITTHLKQPTNLETSRFINPHFVSNDLACLSSFVLLLFYDYCNGLQLIPRTCAILIISNDRIL
jgi:hypothetical protein